MSCEKVGERDGEGGRGGAEGGARPEGGRASRRRRATLCEKVSGGDEPLSSVWAARGGVGCISHLNNLLSRLTSSVSGSC